MMVKAGHDKARGRPDRLGRHHRAGHPAVDRLRDLRRGGQRVDQQAVPGRHRARLLMGVAIAMTWWLVARARTPRRRPRPAAPSAVAAFRQESTWALFCR
jgi:hypothetical protein